MLIINVVLLEQYNVNSKVNRTVLRVQVCIFIVICSVLFLMIFFSHSLPLHSSCTLINLCYPFLLGSFSYFPAIETDENIWKSMFKNQEGIGVN